MARAPVNPQTAASVVQESLGLSADDLGMDREDQFAGMNFDDEGNQTDDDDEGEGDELDVRQQRNEGDEGDDDAFSLDEPEPQPQRRQKDDQNQPDDLSVTHTPQDEFKQQKIKYDGKGNIVAADGKTVLAKAGREARMYTELHKTRTNLQTVRNEAQQVVTKLDGNLKKAIEIGTGLAQQLSALREAGTAHTRLGLSDSEHQEYLQFASAYKKSPIEGLKMILTRAAASGIDLSTLGLQPGGFDSKALLDLIDQRLGTATKPILERNQAETDAQRITREAEEGREIASRELSQFLVTNPDAKQYMPVFEKIYSDPRYANMSLNEVWLRIQLNLAKNPQGRQPQGQNRERLRNRQQPRLPNGRQSPNGGGQRPPREELAPVSESYESIVRGLLTT
jgi:hypothetical protein